MRLLNLRIYYFNFFFLIHCVLFFLILVVFVLFLLHYISAKFHLWPSSGDQLRPRRGMLSLVTESPVITAFHITPCFWPNKPLAGLGRNWNCYLLTMFTWNHRDSMPLSAAPRARGTVDRGAVHHLKKARGENWLKRSEEETTQKLPRWGQKVCNK